MAFIPVPGVIQAELIYNWNSQVVETVLHFRPSDPPTPTLMEELGTEIVTWWSGGIKGFMSNMITLTQVKLTDLTTNTAPVINWTTLLPQTATNTSPSMPNSVTVAITKRTILRGRSYRGRIFHPGLCEAQVLNNTIDPPTLVNLIAEYSEMISFVTPGASWAMVVISRQENNVPRVTGTDQGVISLSSDGVVDSQRRRLPGRGG